MSAAWKPGDVAVDGAGNRLMCAERADGSLVWTNSFGGFYPIDGLIEDARPLVVIDNEFDRTMVKHLRLAAEDNSALTTLPWLADQIESQTALSPSLPSGWGAVVEDNTGALWTLFAPEADVWINYREGKRHGHSINVVRVLTEGVPS